MRVPVVLLALLAGCVGEFEAPERADCELIAPEAVAVDEPFTVEVRCPGQAPSWFEFDFGDGAPSVRTAAAAREHVYDASTRDHLWFRVQVYYPDAGGARQRLEAIIGRR